MCRARLVVLRVDPATWCWLLAAAFGASLSFEVATANKPQCACVTGAAVPEYGNICTIQTAVSACETGWRADRANTIVQTPVAPVCPVFQIPSGETIKDIRKLQQMMMSATFNAILTVGVVST